jgi:hypothetical protein
MTLVLEQFRHIAVEQDVENLAYCFMWDHLHMLVEGKTDTADLRKFATSG